MILKLIEAFQKIMEKRKTDNFETNGGLPGIYGKKADSF